MWPLSLLYRLVILIRRQYLTLLHKDIRYRSPVVVVGNLNIGGTGKTPLVMALASELMQRGFNPGIVSRGYGGRSKRYPLIVTSDTSHEYCGDEPLLIARSTSCPVVVDPDRSEAVKYLVMGLCRSASTSAIRGNAIRERIKKITTSVTTNQKIWLAIQSPQSCGMPMALPYPSIHLLAT